MKKLLVNYVIIGAIFMITGCSEEIAINDVKLTTSRHSKEAVIEDAALRTRSFFFKEKGRSSVSSKGVSYVTSVSSRSSDVDTLMYVVNFDDNQGFAIFSAVEADMPLLAVTDCGEYKPNQKNNEGVEDFIMRAQNKLIAIKDTTNKIGDKSHLLYVDVVRDTLSYVNIPKKVDVRWGQSGSSAKYCPYPDGLNERATGCVPTAIAMIMSYFEYPKTMTWTAPEIDKRTETLKWKDMKIHDFERTNCKNNTRGWCEATEEAHLQIAKVMRELGYIGDAVYGKDTLRNEYIPATSVYEYGTMNILKRLGFKYSNYAIFSGLDVGLLQKNNILLISARNGDMYSGGHCFIVDGCWNLTVRTTETVYDTYFTPWTIVSTKKSTTQRCYMHINWGFDGDSNGYYDDGVFDSSKVRELDDESHRLDKNDGYNVSYKNVRYLPVGLY
jgi:peptidase C10 family